MGRGTGQRDRREVALAVVGHLPEQALVHRERTERADGERVAVRRRLRHHFVAEHRAGTRTVLDDHRLAEGLGEPLAEQATDEIRTAAGAERHDDAHRPARPGLGRRLRLGGGRHRQQHCHAGQGQ